MSDGEGMEREGEGKERRGKKGFATAYGENGRKEGREGGFGLFYAMGMGECDLVMMNCRRDEGGVGI